MTEDESLYEKLTDYAQSDHYPYHMPGHKRRALGRIPEEFYRGDITEIDGFDNLHDAEDILRDLQQKANALYGAKETFYLVNGSTCGILSAVSAALPKGGHILMARGCHKAVYHAAYLRELKITYIEPEGVDGCPIEEAVSAEAVQRHLEKEPDIQAVLIVSPTYEGRIADVSAIAEAVHARDIPLIVDEAHGAHLGFHPLFAPGSCSLGADLVVHSVHKTLPAFTQTALLHRCGDRTDAGRLRRFLRIYQSSSPSYLLMAGINDAMEIVEKQGQVLFQEFYDRYLTMIRRLGACKRLRFVPEKDLLDKRQDVGKLMIFTDRAQVSGRWLYDRLREEYRLQCEMAGPDGCLAMFTVADTPEAYERMEKALLETDCLLETGPTIPNRLQIGGGSDFSARDRKPQVLYPLSEAWDMPWKMTRLSECAGKISAGFVNLYPPGIPILVPGEEITEEICLRIEQYRKQRLNVQGIAEKDGTDYIGTVTI